MPTQSMQVIGFSKETTPGTFVAPTKFVPGTATSTSTVTVTRPTQSRGTRSQVIDEPTAFTSGLQISAELTPEVISQLISGWFGTGADALTGSSTAGYTHTLTPQPSVPTFSIELDSDIYSKILAQQFVYNVVDQVVLTHQASQISTAQFTTLATKEITPATPGTPSNPTPAINTLQPMDFAIMSVNVAGSPNTELISATLTLANQSQYVVAANGTIFPTRIQPTLRSVTFTTTLDFVDDSWYLFWQDVVLDQTGFVGSPGLVLTLQTAYDIPGTSPGTPYEVQFTLPNLRPQDQYSLSSASDVLQQQMSWSVTQGSGANEVSAVIVNSESTQLT